MAPTKGKSSPRTKGSRKPPPRKQDNETGAASKPKKKSSTPSKVQKTTAKDKGRRAGRNGTRTHRDIKEHELDVPALNMITPVGVQKPKGKKKGKVFVDDSEGMMTILALVNAEKEGQIESKMLRERQLEEIRQARQREMEARAQEKKTKLEATKKELRHTKKQPNGRTQETPISATETSLSKKPKKRVSFG